MSNLENKKILVTGGAGFIGSKLVKRLAPDNDVVVLDNFAAGKETNLEGVDVTLKTLSVLDQALYKLFEENSFDVVFHLAASRLDLSLTDQVKDFEVNASGTVRVLDAARKNGVKRFVYSSTGSVYGEPKGTGHDETHPLMPSTPYGTSKMCADHYVRLYHKFFGMETIRLRYYNVYGPGRIAGSVPQFVNRALKGEKIIIQGGEQTRSLTYVDDIVDATILAGVTNKGVGEAFNVSGPNPITILGLAELIVRLCGKEEHTEFLMEDYRPGEIMHLEPDCSKIKRVMGWEPKVTLEQGLTKVIEWMKEINLEVTPLPPTH